LATRHSTSSSQPRLLEHFSAVAERYRTLRDLDQRTVRRVVQLLASLTGPGGVLRVLDVGAGTGRYAEAVVETAAEERNVLCRGVTCDASRFMVGSGVLCGRAARLRLNRVIALAEVLPFREGAFDAVLSFNAIHHFGLDAFLEAAAYVLRPGGSLLIYTRTPEQNARTVWGRYFPYFAERETRLYREDELRSAVARRRQYRPAILETRPWVMRKTLARLVEQARGRCYSTFCFYTPAEFEVALQSFQRRLASAYPDPRRIIVRNDHLLLVVPRL
jgi:SAM-dependent methyltransferase